MGAGWDTRVCHYDGAGKTDLAVFRPADCTWYLRYSSLGSAAGFQGGPTDAVRHWPAKVGHLIQNVASEPGFGRLHRRIHRGEGNAEHGTWTRVEPVMHHCKIARCCQPAQPRRFACQFHQGVIPPRIPWQFSQQLAITFRHYQAHSRHPILDEFSVRLAFSQLPRATKPSADHRSLTGSASSWRRTS